MRLNKPIMTIILVIIMVINLVFFCLISIGQTFNKKEFWKSIINKFDLYNYVINDDEVKQSIDNYNYSIEVFNYINEDKVLSLKETIVNNIIKKKNKIINSNGIKKILLESVNEYEKNTSIDTRSSVEKDINHLSIDISNLLDDDFVNTYNLFNYLSNNIFYILSILISLGLSIAIIIYEKRNGLLIISIVFILYSFLLYYLDLNFISNSYLLNTKYFNNTSNITLMLDNKYMICFILGFVLLLIYIINFIKKCFRDMRIKSYNLENWR